MELAVAMHVKALSQEIDFDFHLVNTQSKIEHELASRRSDNIPYFNRIDVTPCPQVAPAKRILNELCLGKPFYDDLDTSELQIDIEQYDCIWVTNAKIASIAYRLSALGAKHLLLTTNDAVYYFYYERMVASVIGREKRSFNSMINLFRLPFILLNERRYLKKYAVVHVQTQLEERRLQRILPAERADKLCVAPNGINTGLLSLNSLSSGNAVLLMNHMTGGREHQALWFIKKIWPYVVAAKPALRLLVVGTLPPDGGELFKDRFPNVVFTGYVKRLEDVYAEGCISVIPHYQSSGYINRLYDTMGAGVPVIISPQIARTMNGFINGVHGIIAPDKTSLVNNIIALSQDDNQRRIFSQNGRQLVNKAFRWNDSTAKIKDAIQNIS